MRRHRLKLTGIPFDGLVDALTGRPPALWDGDALRIEVFLCDLVNRWASFDVDMVTALALEVRSDTEGDLLASADAAPPFTACTYAAWKADDGYHGVFTLAGTDLALAASLEKVWLSIRATLDDGSPVTFAAGVANLAHAGTGAQSTALTLTSAEPDEEGYFTVTFHGGTFRFLPLDRAEDPDAPYTGAQILITSAEPDGEGYLTATALGVTFRVLPHDLTPAS